MQDLRHLHALDLVQPWAAKTLAFDQYSVIGTTCKACTRSNLNGTGLWTCYEWLNDRGQQLWQQALVQPSKMRFDRYQVERSRTGMLFASCCLEYSSFCSWNNLHIVGSAGAKDEAMRTTELVFLTPHWCLTVNGSKYDLGDRVHRASLINLDSKALKRLGMRPFTVMI